MKVINDNTTNEIKIIKRMIILCWCFLIFCFIIKLFGGNFFNIICENKTFINLCNFIEKSFIYYIIAYISYMLSHFIMFLYILPDIKKQDKRLVYFAICFSLFWLIKFLLVDILVKLNPLICSLIEWLLEILLYILISKDVKKSIIAIVYINLFLVISMFVRNLSFIKVVTENVIITLIFMIDYYIILELLSLYSKYFKIKED